MTIDGADFLNIKEVRRLLDEALGQLRGGADHDEILWRVDKARDHLNETYVKLVR